MVFRNRAANTKAEQHAVVAEEQPPSNTLRRQNEMIERVVDILRS
ncbi:hypothetical protein RSSM_04577 [Rhodopirellula sallentina SM41]|uniref:Uncharacterized protein n=1 Tax=Rhodopirellula sallentina SM41 TaxID=1263870 RepID=M5UD83_9BACT|nr:hypothetical protein RSSM_04577 [Rhodopirellula sallentina SM41]